ncbi:MAG TPA: siphovirus Gp157 family protein [Oscillospiraceae bacterium]|nr:siphovirus Gp157 family protein [Oscillospiraceae bacterium]
MTIYQINEAIFNLMDSETGEIKDAEALDELQMERDLKIENIALWIKELSATEDAIANEIHNLQARKATAANQKDKLKGLLMYALGGDKFKTPRVMIYYGNSQSTEIENPVLFREWAEKNGRDDLLTYKEPAPALTAIAKAIADGQDIPYATIKGNTHIVIK